MIMPAIRHAPLAFALACAALGLPYAPGMFGEKPLAGLLILLLIGIMPLALWCGRRLARSVGGQRIADIGVSLLSLGGIGAHVAVLTSNEPLAALALLLFVVPAQVVGTAIMLAGVKWWDRREAAASARSGSGH
ncbi:MAG: hypothetical protein ACRCTI_11550 [Beijerinckiaceae bacterium]